MRVVLEDVLVVVLVVCVRVVVLVEALVVVLVVCVLVVVLLVSVN